MKKIVRYEANDGVLFKTESEALKRDRLIEQVADIMSVLPRAQYAFDSKFKKGRAYIQHDKSALRKVQVELLEICKNYVNYAWIQYAIDNEDVPLSYVGRLMDDQDIEILRTAGYRFLCIDDEYREWEEPYFKSNHDIDISVCLNPKEEQ